MFVLSKSNKRLVGIYRCGTNLSLLLYLMINLLSISVVLVLFEFYF